MQIFSLIYCNLSKIANIFINLSKILKTFSASRGAFAPGLHTLPRTPPALQAPIVPLLPIPEIFLRALMIILHFAIVLAKVLRKFERFWKYLEKPWKLAWYFVYIYAFSYFQLSNSPMRPNAAILISHSLEDLNHRQNSCWRYLYVK